MKSKIKYFILITFCVLVISSCEDKDKMLFSDFEVGAIPLFTQGPDDTGYIDLIDFSQSNIAFSLAKEGLAEVSSIDVVITYNNSVTGESDEIIYSNVTTLPVDMNITFDDLIAAFNPEVVTKDSLDLGDSFVIGGYMKMADGRYLNGGYSPSVFQKPVLLTYNVACASDLAGSYDFALISGDNGEVSTLADQTIVQQAAGYYEISDMTMDIFGPDFPVKYRFTDICGNLTADAGSVDYGTQIAVRLNPGTIIDPVTGVITFEIEYVSPSCCGLQGIVTVFKATPK
jgi:hypothetical protein